MPVLTMTSILSFLTRDRGYYLMNCHEKKFLKKKYLGCLTSDYLNIVKQQRLVTCGLTTLSMDIL